MDKIRESVERVEEEEMGRAPLQRVSVAQGDSWRAPNPFHCWRSREAARKLGKLIQDNRGG